MQALVLLIVVITVALNLFLMNEFSHKMTIQPKDVLRAVEERLEVTPREVIERLDAIEKAHMKFVQEAREAEKK